MWKRRDGEDGQARNSVLHTVYPTKRYCRTGRSHTRRAGIFRYGRGRRIVVQQLDHQIDVACYDIIT